MSRFSKIISSIVLPIFLGSLLLLVPSQAHALSGSQFQAGRIIDDAIFFNPSTMHTTAIQAFLNAKVPVCDTWHSGSGGNQPPFTCLKDYRQDTPNRSAETGLCNGNSAANKSSAEIIFDVAQSCGVNPQAILVMLQKEQSLISDTWPWAIQYRSAMGYGCPDTAPCDAEYYGFFNQVYAAGRQLKRYVRDATSFNYRAGYTNYILYNPNAACGGSNVYLETRATAALYNYTPYQPNPSALNNLYGQGDECGAYGNRNFWRMFNEWFGTTFGTVLLRGSGDTVYVRGGNPDVAYGVPSGKSLYAYGLQTTAVTPVSDSYLATLNTSSMLSTLFMRPNDGTIFLADEGNAYGIASGEYCIKWGLPCSVSSLVSNLPYNITSSMAIKPPLGNLMQYDNTLFVMENGTKKPFLDKSEKPLSPWANEAPINIYSPLNSAQPGGTPIIYGSRFFGIASTGAIYYYSGGQYFSFNSFDNFKNWFDGSTVLSDRYSSNNKTPPPATLLLNFAKESSSTYLLNGKTKVLLPAGTTVGSMSTDTYPQIASLVQSKQVFTADDSKAFQLPSGSIVTLRNGQLRPIPSMTDLWLSFSPANILPVTSALTEPYPIGKLFIVPGRVVQPNGSGGMYVYGDDGYLWALGSINELNSMLGWVNSTINANFSNIEMQGIKIYSTLIKLNGGYFAVHPDGTVRQLPNTILSAQKDNYSLPLSGPMIGKIHFREPTYSFIRFDNGTIFKVESTNIRPIGSLSTYSSLGGSPSNTIQMSVKAVDAFNVGTPL